MIKLEERLYSLSGVHIANRGKNQIMIGLIEPIGFSFYNEDLRVIGVDIS